MLSEDSQDSLRVLRSGERPVRGDKLPAGKDVRTCTKSCASRATSSYWSMAKNTPTKNGLIFKNSQLSNLHLTETCQRLISLDNPNNMNPRHARPTNTKTAGTRQPSATPPSRLLVPRTNIPRMMKGNIVKSWTNNEIIQLLS